MDYIYSGCIFKTENKLVNYRTFVEIVYCFSIVHKDFLLIVQLLMQDIGTGVSDRNMQWKNVG